MSGKLSMKPITMVGMVALLGLKLQKRLGFAIKYQSFVFFSIAQYSGFYAIGILGIWIPIPHLLFREIGLLATQQSWTCISRAWQSIHKVAPSDL